MYKKMCTLTHQNTIVVSPRRKALPSDFFLSARRRFYSARKSTEFASESKIVDENRGDIEGSSIVDEPGEGWTPVRENRKREPGGF